jgi:hypothetical protein
MDVDSRLHSLLPARRRPRIEVPPEYVAGNLATGQWDALVLEVLPRALRPRGGLSTEDDGYWRPMRCWESARARDDGFDTGRS